MHYEIHRGVVPVDTVLIHGSLGSNRWWYPMVESWCRLYPAPASGEQQRMEGSLILAEWRGCGKSSGPIAESDLEFAILADDYAELVRSLGISSAYLVGHGTGGLIALHALRQEPELFKRAILLDPVSVQGVQVTPDMQSSFIEMSRDRERLNYALRSMISGSEMNADLLSGLVEDAATTHPLIWLGILRKFSLVDFRPELEKIRQPILVLHGERDPVLPVAGSLEIAEGLPEGRFELLSGRGHSCQVETPDRFAEIVNRYFFG